MESDPYGTERALRAAGIDDEDIRVYHEIAVKAKHADRAHGLRRLALNISMVRSRNAVHKKVDSTFIARITDALDRADRFRDIRERFANFDRANAWANEQFQKDTNDRESAPIQGRVLMGRVPPPSEYTRAVSDLWNGQEPDSLAEKMQGRMVADILVEFDPWEIRT